MAYRRASPFLLLATAHLCLMSPHNTAAVSFSYNFSKASDQEKLWYANGNSSAAGDGISITKVNKWSTGRVAYKEAVRLWDDRTGERASFHTSFSFAIGRSGSGDNTGADGMAFFVGPFPPSLPQDSDGAFLGLFAKNKLAQGTVGVEFDTFWNAAPADWEPNDITTDHVGIEVGNIWNIINYTKDLANGSLSGPMEANIAYDAGSKLMVVTLRLANGSSVSVQATLDLKAVAGLGPDAAVGFSAATGNLFESHQLLSWSFSSTDPSSSSTKIQLWVILVLSAASALLAVLVVAMTCFIMMRRKRPPPPMEIELPVARKFSYHELTLATDSFSQDRKLGAGTFGAVYRGDLRDRRRVGAPVAVKKLTLLLEQTRRNYVTEIMILGQLKHRNLVKLVGWCDGGGDDKLLLVYELVTNGSLDDHLHGSSERLLTWPERYKIVLGIGSAIEYLHTGDKDAILHRDIKPSNVMLDDAFEAKLGDFGLVRQVKPGQGSLRGTAMVGSWEYMDPKCITTDSATTASDMYSFGVLLLEIATGKRPRVVPQDDEELSLRNALVDSVRESYGKGAVLEMADARLNGDLDERQMERVMLVGLLCVHQDRRNRPGIREAVNLLSNLGHQVCLSQPPDDVPFRPLVEVMPHLGPKPQSHPIITRRLLRRIMRRPRRAHSMIHIELEVARTFSYKELSAATSNFSEDRRLGAGSFGVVYRGELQDPRMPPVVAVKKVMLLPHQTKDFVTEIITVRQLSHRNLVKLLGWCSGGKLLLVYELVTNGSLDDHLHGSEGLLTWPERYKIVLCVGAAIDYLHNGYRNCILHRDIKPSNVMLDDDFNAKLGDFGLARQLMLDDAFDAKLGDFGLVRQVKPGQGSLRGTTMAGSWGYVDPKCITTDSATTASDMYSFGVLLLEIATGERPWVVDEELSPRNALVDAVRESYGKGAVLEMADARLNGDFDERQMERVMLVGLLCVELERQHRPNIKRAVNLLSDLSLPLL